MLRTNFQLMQSHKYSLQDLENMLPWEREIYVALLIDYIKQQEEQRKQREAM